MNYEKSYGENPKCTVLTKGWPLLKARLFGKRIVSYSGHLKMIAYYYKEVFHITYLK